MSYLIDSDWVIDYLRGIPTAVEFLQSRARDNLAISLMTYGEVYEGIYYGPSRRVSEEGFRQFVRDVSVLVPNRAIMRRFALIRGDLRNRGELIGDPDILIAATALHHNLTLVTENRRHFERIASLSL